MTAPTSLKTFQILAYHWPTSNHPHYYVTKAVDHLHAIRLGLMDPQSKLDRTYRDWWKVRLKGTRKWHRYSRALVRNRSYRTCPVLAAWYPTQKVVMDLHGSVA